MRKTVIALIIVLPMIFILVVFSSLNLVSISVPVSVSGIRILADGDELPKGEGLEVDMADGKSHIITAEVQPANALEKGYTLTSDNPDVLQLKDDGSLTALGEGTANITATSKDKGFTASLPVVVISTKAYGVSFELFDANGKTVPMSYSANTSTYTVTGGLSVGSYGYSVSVVGGDSQEYELTTTEDTDDIRAVIDKGNSSVMLPFSGEAALELTVQDAVVNGMTNRTLRRIVKLNVLRAKSETGIVVNGVADGSTVRLAKGTSKTTMYVECDEEPNLSGEGIKEATCLVHKVQIGPNAGTHNAPQARSGEGGSAHVVEVTLEEGFSAEELAAELTTRSGKKAPVKLSFSDFAFDLRSAVIQGNGNDFSTVILKDTATTFYAVPAVYLQDVVYTWDSNDGALVTTPSQNGASCSFRASADGEYSVTVKAKRSGDPEDADPLDAKTLSVTVTTKVYSVMINNTSVSDGALVERFTVAGQRYNSATPAQNEQPVDNDRYAIKITVSKKGVGAQTNDYTAIQLESSDTNIADVRKEDDGLMYLNIKGTGAITITARWMYNETFNVNAMQVYKLNVVKDAVEVSNYPQLRKATGEARKVVLTRSIMLGTDASGEPLPLEQRQSIANGQKFKSTYNVAWYAENKNLAAAEVMYAQEFKADVYGNGFDIDADYIANAVDSANNPLIFKGPLTFVGFGENYSGARVAAQDNIAFLIRTDGVKLYGVNLLGCSDDSLLEDGNYELNHLNYVGNTLEINADCDIINCRIRNGRNVVRVYGGNRNATHQPMSYYIDAVPAVDVSDEDRIIVNINGCIITQSREFIVKVGTNRAIKATAGNVQPQLKNAQGSVYKEGLKVISVNDESGNTRQKNVGTNQYEGTNDQFFYNRYVMTDLTLENTVMETSGLFCIGVESNFGGEVLCDGSASLYASMLKKEGWANSGATSMASMVRLVGDVRMYDWKDVAYVDSSTLIESGNGSGVLEGILSFNISAMLQEVDGQEEYGKLLYKTSDGKTFVHGGIAYYGGGRNYSQLDLSRLNSNLSGLEHISINVEQFSTSPNPVTSKQTRLLPLAAGTHDFNFWLYAADGANNYDKQVADTANTAKYSGIVKVQLFEQQP